jgi:hypothetical protein
MLNQQMITNPQESSSSFFPCCASFPWGLPSPKIMVRMGSKTKLDYCFYSFGVVSSWLLRWFHNGLNETQMIFMCGVWAYQISPLPQNGENSIIKPLKSNTLAKSDVMHAYARPLTQSRIWVHGMSNKPSHTSGWHQAPRAPPLTGQILNVNYPVPKPFVTVPFPSLSDVRIFKKREKEKKSPGKFFVGSTEFLARAKKIQRNPFFWEKTKNKCCKSADITPRKKQKKQNAVFVH